MRPYTGKRRYNSNLVFEKSFDINRTSNLDDNYIFAHSYEFPVRLKGYKVVRSPKKVSKSGFFNSTSWLVITLFGIAVAIFILGLFARDFITNAKANEADTQNLRVQARGKSAVLAENTVLKDKLLGQMSVTKVDPRTKTIVEYYIAKYFGNEADYAEKVFTCESGLNPNADGVNKNGSHDRGIPQINDSNHKSFEKTTGLDYTTFAHDTETSIRYAKWLRDNSRSGWGNWVCSGIVDGRKA